MSKPLHARAARETLTRVGRYHLLERLGGGAMGSVYAGTDEATGQQVAVKVLAIELAEEPESRERLYREARVTAQLVHPNIVALLDVGEEKGRPFLVTERLHGHRLDAYLRLHHDLTIDAKVALMAQLLEGLQAAHVRGIVHRDIKPGNLFVQRDGVLKILDFGLARLHASTLTASGAIVGTPGYMAPEQAEGHRVDARSDIFSAAAVCYLILTGRAPFAARDLPALLNALLHEDPPPVTDPSVPQALLRAITRGLAKDPDRRYQSCLEMLADLPRESAAAVPGHPLAAATEMGRL